MTTSSIDAAELSSDDAPPIDHRRWIFPSVVVIAVLVVLRLVAPWVLASWLAARLSATLGTAAYVEDVDIRLLAAEITIEGIHAAPPVDASASSIDIDAFTLHWKWRELLRGVAELDGTVTGLDLTIDLHRPWPAAPDDASPRPLHVRELVVESGSAAVVLAADTDPIFALTELSGSMVESVGSRTTDMTTHISLAARTGDGGSFTLEGAIAPVDPASNWTVRLALDQLDLRRLNPLFQQAFEMDVEHGWLSVDGWLTVGFGRFRGQLRPRFEELQLLGRGEQHVRHPMAEAIFGSMLSSADIPIDIDEAVIATGDSMLDGIVHLDANELLGRIILRGFVRRLDTLAGYESKVGRVEVDFPAGRLSFFDIELNRIGGAVGRPFVAVARMDIVVEQSAVDRDVLTYKSVVLHQPSLTFVTGESPDTSQITFDPQWQAKVNVLPYPTDRIEIFDGSVEYRDDTTRPPTSLLVSDVHVRASQLGRAKARMGRRGAKLVGSARVMDLSDLTFELEFSPGAVDLDAAIHLQLAPLQLSDLNGLTSGRLGMDVSTGTLALTADLDVHAGHLRGAVTPKLSDVKVLGDDETEFDHPIREFLLERRLRKLDGLTLTLDHRVRTSVLRELPSALLSAARRAR